MTDELQSIGMLGLLLCDGTLTVEMQLANATNDNYTIGIAIKKQTAQAGAYHGCVCV
jgi:hypothetical protein